MTLSYLECSRMCSIDSVGHSLGVHRGQKMSTLAGVLCDAEQDTGISWGGGDIHLLDVVLFTGDREAGLGALLGHCSVCDTMSQDFRLVIT
jgi:hypothetical protein